MTVVADEETRTVAAAAPLWASAEAAHEVGAFHGSSYPAYRDWVRSLLPGQAPLVVADAEDDTDEGSRVGAQVEVGDVAIGLTASGRTPFVLAALAAARERGAFTALIDCNGSGTSNVNWLPARSPVSSVTSFAGAFSEQKRRERRGELPGAVRDLLGADPRRVVHGRSATQLTYDLSRAVIW